MKYEKISGWFNFQDIYKEAVERFDNCTMVEIGTFLGKSASYMGEMIQVKKKNIEFYTIDTFEGSKTELNGKQAIYKTVNVYERAHQNLKGLPVHIIKSTSIQASKMFKDNSLAMVFIDGSHTYEDFTNDLIHWYPKVKGILAGHDYDTVMEPLDKFIKEKGLRYAVRNTSWIIV